MEDLLELNEVAKAIKTEIILPRSNKTIKAHTPLVLMGTSMNVMMGAGLYMEQRSITTVQNWSFWP